LKRKNTRSRKKNRAIVKTRVLRHVVAAADTDEFRVAGGNHGLIRLGHPLLKPICRQREVAIIPNWPFGRERRRVGQIAPEQTVTADTNFADQFLVIGAHDSQRCQQQDDDREECFHDAFGHVICWCEWFTWKSPIGA
jgi:hypothetical protein